MRLKRYFNLKIKSLFTTKILCEMIKFMYKLKQFIVFEFYI